VSYIEHAPPPDLRAAVACTWVARTGVVTRPSPVLVDACSDVVVIGDDPPHVAGPATRTHFVHVPAHTTVVGIRLRPGATRALFGCDAHELRDADPDLRAVCGVSVSTLQSKLADAGSSQCRRAALEELLGHTADPIRLSPLLEAPAGQVLDAVQKLGLEGVVGKRAGSIYEPGERSGVWIKQRTNAEQEFVIGGYKPGSYGFDSLLVGVYEGKQLMFVARVKNGFVPRLREEIFAKFKNLQTEKCPFVNLPEKKGARRGDVLSAEKMKECRWLKPKLVCQVSFVEWTNAGNLRHANFVAMRDDKDAADVSRET
jgi:hypothetical protein